MATTAEWVEGARPRTLLSAVAPVLVGTGAAIGAGEWSWWRAALALLVSLALQVGVNFANDYSDGIRGTDEIRVGPLRLVGSGAARPASVKAAAFGCFALAALAGLVLALASSWWLIIVGALAIAAAWGYTGGAKPYGYRALGELSVFVFFGLIAVVGTWYVQTQQWSWVPVVASLGPGSLACALLVVNNLRDLHNDAVAGKHTLAVRIGEYRTRRLYAALLAVPYLAAIALASVNPWTLLALLGAPLSVMAARPVLAGATGRALIPSLRETGITQLVFGLLLGLGLALRADASRSGGSATDQRLLGTLGRLRWRGSR